MDFCHSLSIIFFFFVAGLFQQGVCYQISLRFYLIFVSIYHLFEFMDQFQLIKEELESSNDDHPTSSSPSTEQMETVELDTPCEKLQRQIEELTRQLNESI